MKRITAHRAPEALVHPQIGSKSAVPLLHEGVVATLMFGIGFAPITALALSIMGILTLPFATLLLVVPALVIAMGLSCYEFRYGRLMLHGFVMGIIAVACYDGVRIPFVMAGWMDDFIPSIGGMLVGDGNRHAVLGYLWRYLGNGGGMGMAFVCAFAVLRQLLAEHHQTRVTPRVTKQIALGFGCLVWVCLIVTLKISSGGEDKLFVITPVSLLLSWIGHLVFGYALGCLVSRLGPEEISKGFPRSE
jgi:predicted outer membrane lipoprotein